MTTPRLLPSILALLALAACGSRTRDVDRLDRELLNGAAAAGSAAKPEPGARTLADEIVVDPARVGRADANRAPVPRAAPAPARIVRADGGGAGQGDCYARLSYGARWATRLPVALALPAGARVTEAAGSDRAGCRARIVSFASAAAPARLAAVLADRGRAGGYAVTVERRRRDTVVAGDHPGDARAFYVTLTPAPGGGSTADLVSNDGR